jgi:phospholipid/cholesterol/gamma-HCH transport system ATP-binding protein
VSADGGAEPILKVRGLTNRFGEQIVHEDLDLDVMPGEIIGVVGGSGTGKSVLMRAILGLRAPQAGDIHVLGVDALHSSTHERLKIERNSGVLYQNGALFSSLTVAENVMVPLKEHHAELPFDLIEDLAMLKIRLAGLPDNAADKYPSQLSGGMVKRAALARALALDPAILFLDEPTAGLDPISANQFDELINQLQESLGLTVMMVTHDIDTLRAVTDRIAVLVNKKLVIGTIDELRKNQDPWIKDYFSGVRGRAALSSLDMASQEAH